MTSVIDSQQNTGVWTVFGGWLVNPRPADSAESQKVTWVHVNFCVPETQSGRTMGQRWARKVARSRSRKGGKMTMDRLVN